MDAYHIVTDLEELQRMQDIVSDSYDKNVKCFCKGQKIIICDEDGEETGAWYVLSGSLDVRTHHFYDDNNRKEDTIYLLGRAMYYKNEFAEKGIPVYLKMVSNKKRVGVEKFKKESRFGADFPCIERVYRMDFARHEEDTANRCLFVALAVEYVDGFTYGEYFWKEVSRQSDGTFESWSDELLMYRIWYQMLCAVRFYYEDRRTVHRDMHPENIMIRNGLRGEKRSVIIDFDSAHLESLKSVTRAPEVLGYEVRDWVARKLPKNDIRRDCYSLGWLFMYAILGDHYYNCYFNFFGWVPEMYGLDTEILKKYAPGYLNDKYNSLFALIEEMVSAPLKDKADFDSIAYITGIIKKYDKLVLDDLVSKEEKKVIMHPDSYLEARAAQDPDLTREFTLQCSGTFIDELANYGTRELSFTKQPRDAAEDPNLCIQNINGELFYTPYDKGIRTNVQNYRLSDIEENWFEMNGKRISLQLIKCSHENLW